MKNKVKGKLNLEKGVKFLKVSFICLIILFIIFLTYLLSIGTGFLELISIIFRKPSSHDFFVIFAGAVIFGFVPFFLGVRLKR